MIDTDLKAAWRSKPTFEYGGIAQLGERLNGIQEVSGSIPLISTIKKRLTEALLKESTSLSLLRDSNHVPWKLNIVIMMQLWEGNSKENVLQMDILKIICKGKNTIFAKENF